LIREFSEEELFLTCTVGDVVAKRWFKACWRMKAKTDNEMWLISQRSISKFKNWTLYFLFDFNDCLIIKIFFSYTYKSFSPFSRLKEMLPINESTDKKIYWNVIILFSLL
jgi:hypothetical protein